MPGTALWTGSFVFLCLPSFVSPVVSQPGCLARLSGRVHVSPFVSLHFCLPLSPLVSLHFLSPLSPSPSFICLRIHLPPFVSHLFLVVSQPRCLCLCLPSGWTDCLPAPPGEPCQTSRLGGNGALSSFVCLQLSPSLDAWHGLLVDLICLALSPWFCLPLQCLPAWDAWHGALGGRIHLSLFVSLYLSPVVTDSCEVYSAGRHVCLRLKNACLRARVRLIKPQAACCGCTHECFR